MSLFRLVYVSDSSLPPGQPEAFTDAISQILATAREANARNNITGALRVSPGHFAQVLEGPPEAVKATYGRIACDPRHRAARLLDCGAVDARLFPDWSMAFVDASGLADVPLFAPSADAPSTAATALVELLRLYVVNANNPAAGAPTP